MSEISIDTLKTMLANLDDAKKYQSLRDVMETLPAPDLAAVFEDLPAEKLPVLFRLCPKDLAADVFTELAPETQQKLIDGLTDTELKAVVDDLAPRVVIPMHYRSDHFGYPVIGRLEEFTGLCRNVVEYDSNTLLLTAETRPQTAVLKL